MSDHLVEIMSTNRGDDEDIDDEDDVEEEDDYGEDNDGENEVEVKNVDVEDLSLSPLEQSFSDALIVHDLDHLDDFEGTVIPDQALNFNIPWRAPGEPDDDGEENFPDPALENFLSNTSPEKFSHDAQVLLFLFLSYECIFLVSVL